jgi:hypothetical protein
VARELSVPCERSVHATQARGIRCLASEGKNGNTENFITWQKLTYESQNVLYFETDGVSKEAQQPKENLINSGATRAHRYNDVPKAD